MSNKSEDRDYPEEENVPQNQGEDYPQEDEAPQAEEAGHEPVDEEERSGKSQDLDEVSHHKEKKPSKVNPSVLVFTIFNFAAFVFCLAGMTIGMADSRTDSSCISIWGYKPQCLKSWFRHMDFEDFMGSGKPCNKGNSLVQGAQAFSVMSIIGGFLTTCVAFLLLFHVAELAVVAAIMSSINMVATLVVWSTMLAFYWANLCGVVVFADTYKLGNGLILFITAWCLQIIGTGVLMIDIYLGNSK